MRRSGPAPRREAGRSPDPGELTSAPGPPPDGVPAPDAERLGEAVGRVHWRTALRASESPAVRAVAGRVENLNVANWHMLVPLPATATALDVGADLGTVAHALALSYRRVVALDPSAARARFARHRLDQERLTGAHAVAGDLLALPVRRSSVDLVVLLGVLGAVAREAQGGRPAESQRRLLEEVRAALKPGGWVVLGVDNRFASSYLAGAPDPDFRLPWAGLLPRPLARALAWIAGRPGATPSLHSVRGYRRLLARAGFEDVRVWCALPGYAEPRLLVACAQGPFAHFLANLSAVGTSAPRRIVRGLLHRLGLLKYMAPSYCILARGAEAHG